MVGYWQGVLHSFSRYRHLLVNLVQRDIKVKYRRSTLGLVWSILNPLLMMLVMTLVFSVIFTGGAENMPTVSVTGEPPVFAVYLLSGMLIFTFFSEATQLAMDSVLSNAPLIKKVYIPKYIFPLEKVIFSLINTLFSMVALVLVIVVTGSPVTGWAALFWVPLVLLFVFNLGVGLILSALTVFFRDIKHFYGVIVLALNYMTPVFYHESMFNPNPQLAQVMFYILRANPMYWYVTLFRQVVVYGRAPTFIQIGSCVGFSVLVLILGLLIFKKAQDRFILYV